MDVLKQIEVFKAIKRQVQLKAIFLSEKTPHLSEVNGASEINGSTRGSITETGSLSP